jgi:molybdopterin synthase sulfur carrier subunit
MIRVLFFGPVAERVGARQIELPYRAGLTWRDVRDELAPRHPEAFALVAVVAVDGQRVAGEQAPPLADGSEIVFMSHFSGG